MVSKGEKIILTLENRKNFVKLAFQQRMEEMAPAAHLVRQGICEIAPVPIIDLMPISGKTLNFRAISEIMMFTNQLEFRSKKFIFEFSRQRHN